MKGRKPIPTSLKLIKGTAQKCRMNLNEPESSSDNIKKPSWLSKVASKHWDEVIHELIDTRIMTRLDIEAFALYCESFATYDRANKNIELYGETSVSAEGHKTISPYTRIANTAYDQMKSMLVEFGMTPSARTRIRVKPKQEQNEFDFF